MNYEWTIQLLICFQGLILSSEGAIMEVNKLLITNASSHYFLPSSKDARPLATPHPSVASSITAVWILKIEAVTVRVFGHSPPK